MADPRAAIDLKRVLRTLILAEIGSISLRLLFGLLLEERFLPPLLQQYERERFETDPGASFLLALVIGIPALVIWAVSWVALWRGWRTGRRLYTLGWLLGLPLSALLGPSVSTGFGDALDTVMCAAGGAILALLYFSDLRGLYGIAATEPRSEDGVALT